MGPNFPGKRRLILVFNAECLLLGRNFDFLGGYLVVTARYLMVTTGYCSLSGGYYSLQVITARYRSLLFVPIFSMDVFCYINPVKRCNIAILAINTNHNSHNSHRNQFVDLSLS